MNNVFFTADLHLGHESIIKHSSRPFNSVQEMDEKIIDNWNEVVHNGDIIYVLGDMCWKNHKEYARRLNGQINLAPGNHDKMSQIGKHINILKPIHEIKLRGSYPVVLCHFAMRTWNKSHFNSWHLYGHSHGGLEGLGKSMDVGIDTNNFYPYHQDEIIQIMNDKPNNFNYKRGNKRAD